MRPFAQKLTAAPQASQGNYDPADDDSALKSFLLELALRVALNLDVKVPAPVGVVDDVLPFETSVTTSPALPFDPSVEPGGGHSKVMLGATVPVVAGVCGLDNVGVTALANPSPSPPDNAADPDPDPDPDPEAAIVGITNVKLL